MAQLLVQTRTPSQAASAAESAAAFESAPASTASAAPWYPSGDIPRINLKCMTDTFVAHMLTTVEREGQLSNAIIASWDLNTLSAFIDPQQIAPIKRHFPYAAFDNIEELLRHAPRVSDAFRSNLRKFEKNALKTAHHDLHIVIWLGYEDLATNIISKGTDKIVVMAWAKASDDWVPFHELFIERNVRLPLFASSPLVLVPSNFMKPHSNI